MSVSGTIEAIGEQMDSTVSEAAQIAARALSLPFKLPGKISKAIKEKAKEDGESTPVIKLPGMDKLKSIFKKEKKADPPKNTSENVEYDYQSDESRKPVEYQMNEGSARVTE